MNVRTSKQSPGPEGVTGTQTREEVLADFARLIKDRRHNIIWTDDVNHPMPFEPIGTHTLPSGLKVHTGKLPDGLLHEIANIDFPVGDFDVVVAGARSAEVLFKTERINKKEAAATIGSFLGKVLEKVDAWLPASVRPYVKVFVVAADGADQIWGYSAEHKEASPLYKEGLANDS